MKAIYALAAILLLSSKAFAAAHLSEILSPPDRNWDLQRLEPRLDLEPIRPRLEIPSGYGKECSERREDLRQLVAGDVHLIGGNTAQAEGPLAATTALRYRCTQHVQGDVHLDTAHRLLSQPQVAADPLSIVFMPWLQQVDERLILEPGPYFQQARFPRLQQADELILRLRKGTGEFHLTQLQSLNRLWVQEAGISNDLSHLNQLTELGRLQLDSHPNDIDGPFDFKGLGALQSAGEIDIDLYSGSASEAFLANLQSVTGDVSIRLEQSGLFGFGALQEIGGTLAVRDSPYIYRLDALGNLQSIGGLELEATGLRDLAALQNLSMTAGGKIVIRYNQALDDCSAQALARQLLQEPNRTNFNSSRVKVYGNGFSDCQAQ